MISPSGDIDYFNFTITETTTIALYTVSNLDTIGYLYDSSGNEIHMSDDTNYGMDFFIEITLNPGLYYLKVSDYGSDYGNYMLYFELIA
ncbi:DVUA0089 family protein [Mycoplasmatota bacterium]|nr:DVUA0089 family protein [Mycoplasmatota bacterium]